MRPAVGTVVVSRGSVKGVKRDTLKALMMAWLKVLLLEEDKPSRRRIESLKKSMRSLVTRGMMLIESVFL